jgi:phosphate transport system permease protein
MRTLAANAALDAPKSVPGSTHFRVLMLSALLLFGLAFVFNGLAERVRERLRRRYRDL